MVGVDWWDAVGCTQSAAEDGIGNGALFLLEFDVNHLASRNNLKRTRSLRN